MGQGSGSTVHHFFSDAFTILLKSIPYVYYSLYIDNLPKLLEQNNVTAKLFADDVKLYLEIDNDEDRVKFQVVLDLITDWANAWQLQVSVAKCNILNRLETPQ